MMCEMIVIVTGTICIAVSIKVLYQIVNITIVIRSCYHNNNYCYLTRYADFSGFNSCRLILVVFIMITGYDNDSYLVLSLIVDTM